MTFPVRSVSFAVERRRGRTGLDILTLKQPTLNLVKHKNKKRTENNAKSNIHTEKERVPGAFCDDEFGGVDAESEHGAARREVARDDEFFGHDGDFGDDYGGAVRVAGDAGDVV